MPDFAVVTAFKATDRVSPAFKRMGKSADKFGASGSRAFGRVSRSGNSLIGTMKSLLPLFGVATIARYANKAIELASSLEEVQNVVDTTFGAGSKEIDKFADTAITKFGLSELQAKEFTGVLGSMAKSSGIADTQLVEMSKSLAGLAGDYASFRNMKPEEAFEKMKSVITGETEPLRQLGINMNVTNLEAFALSKGINKAWKQMSQAEQVTLRYNYVMEKSKDAQGDFNKTLATSYANQKRVLGVKFDQFLAKIMVKILPKLVSLFSALNRAIDRIDTDAVARGLRTIADIVPWLVISFVSWKAAVYGVIAAQKIMLALGWLKYLWMMREFITAATVKQWLWNAALSANPIGLITIAVAGLIAGIIALIKYGDKLHAMFMKISKILDNPIIKALLGTIFPNFGRQMVAIREKTQQVQESTRNAEPPNRNQLAAQRVNLQGEINIAGAPEGTTASSKTRGAPPVKMNVMGKN
jgi:hypothetical protein